MTLAFAQYLAGALARARGDLAGAAEHLAAQLRAVGPGPTPPASYAIDAEAELALWEGRPEAALSAADEGLASRSRTRSDGCSSPRSARKPRPTSPSSPAHAATRPPRPPPASARPPFATGRATAPPTPRIPRWPRRSRPNTPRRRNNDPASVGRGRARLGGAARAVPGRLRPLAPGRGVRWRGANAPKRSRRCTPRTPWPPASARAPWQRRSKPWRAARVSRWRPPPRNGPRADLPPAGAELGLTARELEVLQHLARGATNRQIAEALYISVRTAGVHVSHILGKLSAANRGEAAAIAHRLGLVP